MAFKLNDPEFATQLRKREVAKLKYGTAFNAILPTEIVDPTFKYEWNVMEDAIKVNRSKHGIAGQRSIIGQDRTSTDMQFSMVEFDIPWTEEWMKGSRSAGTLPIPIQEARRMGGAALDEILRDMDTFALDNLIGYDASADALAGTLSASKANRKEFVDTVLGILDSAETSLAQGELVLGIDSSKLPYLALPYEDTGATGLSVNDILTKALGDLGSQARIVGVQNPTMDGKAVLHYREQDNASFLHSTPQGVQLMFGQNGDNKVMRFFHHYGMAELRDNATAGHTHVISGL